MRIAFAFTLFLAGVVVGGFLFSKSLPRSFLAVAECGGRCLESRDLLGLIASAGLLHAPGLIPRKAAESKRCVGVHHWAPEGRYHVVFFPKRDARHMLELQEEDLPYLHDCLELARREIESTGLQNYRIVSNGPALQHLTYFHIHVIAR